MANRTVALTAEDEAALRYGMAHWPFEGAPADAATAFAVAVDRFVLAPWRDARAAEQADRARAGVEDADPTTREALADALAALRTVAPARARTLLDDMATRARTGT